MKKTKDYFVKAGWLVVFFTGERERRVGLFPRELDIGFTVRWGVASFFILQNSSGSYSDSHTHTHTILEAKMVRMKGDFNGHTPCTQTQSLGVCRVVVVVWTIYRFRSPHNSVVVPQGRLVLLPHWRVNSVRTHRVIFSISLDVKGESFHRIESYWTAAVASEVAAYAAQ